MCEKSEKRYTGVIELESNVDLDGLTVKTKYGVTSTTRTKHSVVIPMSTFREFVAKEVGVSMPPQTGYDDDFINVDANGEALEIYWVTEEQSGGLGKKK